MATSGFFVRNDDGFVQVDQNWQNFMMRELVKFDIPNYGGNAYYNIINLTVQGSANAVFATTTSVLGSSGDSYAPKAVVMKAVPNPTNQTWALTIMVMNRTGVTIQGLIYIFDIGNAPVVNGNVGLAIFNENHDLVYHSSGLPMRVTQYVPNSGRKYAVINNVIGSIQMPRIQGLNGTGAFLRTGVCVTTSGPFETQIYGMQRDANEYFRIPADWITLDVTDYE